MKKRYFLGVGIALSIICVLVLVTQLYAVKFECEHLWNTCQYECQGNPVYWCYEGGIKGVECQDCESPSCSDNWGPWDCD